MTKVAIGAVSFKFNVESENIDFGTHANFTGSHILIGFFIQHDKPKQQNAVINF